MQSSIPKRIIQTGKAAPTSVRLRAMVANLRLLHPDYEYLFFDDAAVLKFMDEEFPEYRTIFDSFPHPIQRFDFFRYLAVYKYGGFYFDLDILLASDLSQLLQYECVFPFEGLTLSRYLRDHLQIDWEIGNYGFGAAPAHPFLKAVIDNCVRVQVDPDWIKPMLDRLPPFTMPAFEILNTTGPGLVSRTLAENTQAAQDVTILFPEDVCDKHNWNCFGDFGIHLMDGTWRSGNRMRRRLAVYFEGKWTEKALKQSKKLGPIRTYPKRATLSSSGSNEFRPLVSILIPAYNAQDTIAATLRSALDQTWNPKEIIVVDDGSRDGTVAVARQFESCGVSVIEQKNRGAAAARNKALSLSKGDYIQWLDADDILSSEKISRQIKAVGNDQDRRVLLSCPWAHFLYRHHRAAFTPSALWEDLSPKEWLLRKLGQNVYMQTATWLVSRELTEAAGPWDTRLISDDDGEYFCRVILASDFIRFVPDAKVYYRSPGLAFSGLSHVGLTDRKIDAHWLSMQLHIQYLRSLEDSDRVKEACMNFLQVSMIHFYPERRDIVEQVERIAEELGGRIKVPNLSWKYAWIKNMFGWRLAKRGRQQLLELRWGLTRRWDKLLFHASNHKLVRN
jgi:glycosyltransferase involved in cell wall biosynthesis